MRKNEESEAEKIFRENSLKFQEEEKKRKSTNCWTAVILIVGSIWLISEFKTLQIIVLIILANIGFFTILYFAGAFNSKSNK